jgi:hypothetical protein
VFEKMECSITDVCLDPVLTARGVFFPTGRGHGFSGGPVSRLVVDGIEILVLKFPDKYSDVHVTCSIPKFDTFAVRFVRSLLPAKTRVGVSAKFSFQAHRNRCFWKTIFCPDLAGGYHRCHLPDGSVIDPKGWDEDDED